MDIKNTSKGFPFQVYLNCPDVGSIMNYLNCYIEENIDNFFDKIYEFEKKLYIEKTNKNDIDENDNIQIYKNISFKLDTVHDFTESRKDESVLSTQDIFTYLDWKDIYPNKKNNFESDFFFWLLRRKEFINYTANGTKYKDFELYVTSTIENYSNLSINSGVKIQSNGQPTELNIVIDASDTKVNNFKNLILFQNFYDQAVKENKESGIKKIQCVNREKNPSNSLELREITTNELVDKMITNNKLNCKIIYPQLFDANATTGKTIKWRNYNIGKLDVTNDIDEIEFKILENTCRIVFVKNTKTVYFQIKGEEFYFNTIKIEQPQTVNREDNISRYNNIKNNIIKKLEIELNKNERELESKNFKIKEKIKIQGKNYVKTKQLNLLFYNTGPGISDLLRYYESYKNLLISENAELTSILRYILEEMKNIRKTDDNIIFIKILIEFLKNKKIDKNAQFNDIVSSIYYNFFQLNKYNKHIVSLIYIFSKLIDRKDTSREPRITIETLKKIADEYYETKYKKLAENIFIIKRAGDYSQIFYCKTKRTNDKEYIFSSVDRMSASFCLLEKVNFIGTIKEYGIFLNFSKNIVMDDLIEPNMKCNKLYHYKSYINSPNISKYIKFLSINFNLNYMKCYDVLFYYEIAKLILTKKDENLTNDDIRNLYKNMAFKIDTVHDFKKDRTNGIFLKEDEDKIYSILWKRIDYKGKSLGYEPGSILDRNFFKKIITKINDKVDYDEIKEDTDENNEDDEIDENKEEDDVSDIQNYDIEDDEQSIQSNIKEDKKFGIIKVGTTLKVAPILKTGIMSKNEDKIIKKRKYDVVRDTETEQKKRNIDITKLNISNLKKENEIKLNKKEDIINKSNYTDIDVGTALTFILENLEENFFYWLIHRQHYPMGINGIMYKLENQLDVVFSSSIENFSECISNDKNTLCIDASSKIIGNFKNMLIVNNILKKYPNLNSLENKINEFKNSINNDIYFFTKKQGEEVFNYIRKNLSEIISDIIKINSIGKNILNETNIYENILNIYYNLLLILRLCIINEISTEYINTIFYILNGPGGVLEKLQINNLLGVFDIIKSFERIQSVGNRENFLNIMKKNYNSWFNINDETLLYLLLDENIIEINKERTILMKLVVIFSNIDNSEKINDILSVKLDNDDKSNFEKTLKLFMSKKKKNRQFKDKNDYIIEHLNYIYKQLEDSYKIDYEAIYKDEIMSRIQYEAISNDTGAKFKIIPPQIFDANTSTGKHITIRKKNIEDAFDSSDKFCKIDKYRQNLELYKKNNIDIIKLIEGFSILFKKLSEILINMKKFIDENIDIDKQYNDLIYNVIYIIKLKPEKREEGAILIKNYVIFINHLYNVIRSYSVNEKIFDKINDTVTGFIKFTVKNVDKIKEYINLIGKLIRIEHFVENIHYNRELFDFMSNSELLGYGKINKVLLYSEILEKELKLYKDSESMSIFNECDINMIGSNIKSNFTECESLYSYSIKDENNKKVNCNVYEIVIKTNLDYPIEKVKVFNINKEEIKGILTETIISNEIANIILKDILKDRNEDYKNNIFYIFLEKNMNKNIFTQYIETIKGRTKTNVNISEKYSIYNDITNKNHTYYCSQNKTLYCYDTGPGVADLSLFYKNYLEKFPDSNEQDILNNIFDIKRYGDYSQIAYCKSNRYIYVSNDRMSASFSFIEGSDFIGPFKSYGLFLKNKDTTCTETKNKIENDSYEDFPCEKSS